MINALQAPPAHPLRVLSAASSPLSHKALNSRFQHRIRTNPALDRTLVSFQANKRVPFYSWFKYREGFSEQLVTYLLQTLHPQPGRLLDPFAGSGSALFAAQALGWQTEGVEVLPVGAYVTRARLVAAKSDPARFRRAVAQIRDTDFREYHSESHRFNHVAITRGAFRDQDQQCLEGYLAYCDQHIADDNTRTLLRYAAFCILEDISFTRKDGQYLRWDARSGRSQGKRPFNKGCIMTFRDALDTKLDQMAGDLDGQPLQPGLFGDLNVQRTPGPDPVLQEGSCLTILPTMEDDSFDFVLTSPPYANRYDYTRTYALELVYLGCDEDDIKRLRQAMLSCTVENKDKRAQIGAYYRALGRERHFCTVESVFQQQDALQDTLNILDAYREQGKLNNDNVARLVRNYFYEMCFVVSELARTLRPGGIVAMVNDNVQYAGEEIPVDLILSNMAEAFGLRTRHIWTLGRGKGNSSQQMGSHGRSELRKCVYVWEK